MFSSQKQIDNKSIGYVLLRIRMGINHQTITGLLWHVKRCGAWAVGSTTRTQYKFTVILYENVPLSPVSVEHCCHTVHSMSDKY